MTPTKLLIGQAILTVAILTVAIVIGAVWGATQWAAASLAHQPRLGGAWFVFAEIPVYPPWRLFQWWYAYEAYAPRVFNTAGALAAAGGVLAVIVAVIGSVWRARQTRFVTTYGSSRWARTAEVRVAGLFEPSGVFLGRLGKHYLRHDGPEHVMAFAPTRSGKGVGLVVPTLLSWTGSAVIHDIKGENWRLTAGWRARFSHCLLFNPTDGRSARYNPLLDIRKGPGEVRDAQNIADILVDPEGALERRSHWEKTAHSLLVGAILHVLHAEDEKTLAQVAGVLSDPQRPFEQTLRAMMTTDHLGEGGVHPIVAGAARELLNKSENERSGVLSTAISFLALYRDPTVAAATAACDWRIADLMDAARPVSLYLVVPPSDISRTKPLIRLILNQIGRRLTESLDGEPGGHTGADGRDGKGPRHTLLLMLDEFPALGRLDFFESALAFMAGYGIRAYLIAQSLNQIVKAYGDNNSILDNCHVRIAFAANDERTARRISDSLGTATEQRAQRNYAGHRLAPWLAHVMVSRQETARPLLTPGEVMQLPAHDQLVLVSGLAPLRARKLRYYEDRNFTARILPPPVLAETGYADAPAPRGDDWSGTAAGAGSTRPGMRDADDADDADDSAGGDSGGGLERHPALAEEVPAPARYPADPDAALLDDDPDTPMNGPADPLRRIQGIARAHAMNQGDDDLVPRF